MNIQTIMLNRRAPVSGGAAGFAVFDKIMARGGLVVLSPLMVVVAAAIVIDSGFPVFFSQDRLGQGGWRFRMHKFRKFHARRDLSTCPLTLSNDERFTRLGKILERTKLDELPQLWNILRGDMAVVGPRPEVPDFADCFVGPSGRVLNYRPGILGPSQAIFRSESALYPPGEDPDVFYREVLFPAKASLDLAYYPSRSFFSDLGWIVRGLLAVGGVDKLKWLPRRRIVAERAMTSSHHISGYE